ncbi:WD40 repeat domain-containing protein [Thermococcus barophilus]|nr:hypothetical protein [Thermococcus barophilus]
MSKVPAFTLMLFLFCIVPMVNAEKIEHLWAYNINDFRVIDISSNDELISVGIGQTINGTWTEGGIVVLSLNGRQMWNYTGDFGYCYTAISNNSYIATGCRDGTIMLFDKNGNLLWKFNAMTKVKRVAISEDGSIVAASSYDGNLYVFSREGLKWKRYLEDKLAGVSISKDNQLIAVGGFSGYVYILSLNGEILGAYLTKMPVFAVDFDKTYVVAGDYNGTVVYLSPNGTLIWKIQLRGSIWDLETFGGKILVGTANGDFSLLSNNGNILWEEHLGNTTKIGVFDVSIFKRYLVGVAVDTENGGGGIYLVDENETILWKFEKADEYFLSVDSNNNQIIVGTSIWDNKRKAWNKSKIYAFGIVENKTKKKTCGVGFILIGVLVAIVLTKKLMRD